MKTLLQILKLVPFPIVTAVIILIWKDVLFGAMIAAALWWLTIPAIILSIVFFFMGLHRRDNWEHAAVILGIANLLLFIIFLLVQLPKQHCDADTMGKHYEKYHTEMEELHCYVKASVADSCGVMLEFSGNKIESFRVHGPLDDKYFGGRKKDVLQLKDSLMTVVGLTDEEFDGIHQRLKSMDCIGIRYSQTTPESISIMFRYVEFVLYSYNIYSRPMTDEEKHTAMKYPEFIPYNEYCTFEFEGGAIGPQSWGNEKNDYLNQHQPW